MYSEGSNKREVEDVDQFSSYSEKGRTEENNSKLEIKKMSLEGGKESCPFNK